MKDISKTPAGFKEYLRGVWPDLMIIKEDIIGRRMSIIIEHSEGRWWWSNLKRRDYRYEGWNLSSTMWEG